MTTVRLSKSFREMTAKWLEDNLPGSRLVGTHAGRGEAYVWAQVAPRHFESKTVWPV